MMIRKQKLPSSPSSQSGFTLIECLIAIIIVGVLLVAVAPAVILSVATRVQARRVEGATEAARAYVDGVRAGTIPAPPNVVLLQPDKTNAVNQNLFAGIAPAPSGAAGWVCTATFPNSNPTYCVDGTSSTGLYCVDKDDTPGCNSRSNRDFVVQAFRSVTTPAALTDLTTSQAEANKGYIMGIRVYRADALAINGPLQTSVNSQDPQGRARRQVAYAGGAGDRSSPLLEFTTEIRGSGTDWKSLCERLGGCQSSPTGSPPPIP
jgi:prepilin-type N-terminal cleavage/methylation domain-containing protein